MLSSKDISRMVPRFKQIGSHGWPERRIPSRERACSRGFCVKGKISSVEFIMLVYDDVRVHPCETRSQYDVTLGDGGPLLLLPKLHPDDWTRQQTRIYNDVKAIMAMRGEQHLEVAHEIERRAQEGHVVLTSADRQAWNEYINFWGGRVGASKSMVDSVSEVADQASVPAVPIII